MSNLINIFLLSFGALQGVILSLWMLRDQPRRQSNLYFSLFIIVAGLQLTFKVVTKIWLMHYFYLPYVMSYSLPFIAGPLVYFYIKSRMGRMVLFSDILHIVPFVASLALSVMSTNIYYTAPIRGILQLISFGIYGYMAWKTAGPSLRQFVIASLTIESLIAISLSLSQILYGRLPDVKLVFILLTVLIYWISYVTISRPDLFLEIETKPTFTLGLIPKTKYLHSSLTPEEAIRIENTLTLKMQNEKPFLNPALTIDLLAQSLETSRHHLSQVLNERLSKTYSDFITDARLSEARLRLSDSACMRFTIASIALDSGFNSVSSFNDVFKKRFGITPSKFRDENLKKMSA